MRWTPVAPLAASLLPLLACNLDIGGGSCHGNCSASATLDPDDTGTGTDSDTDSGGPPNFWPGVVCAPDADETPRFYFDLRAGKDQGRDFFRLPFPADARRKGGGIDLEGFPRAPAEFSPAPELATVIDRWMAHIEQDTDGFAVEGAVLFRSSVSIGPVKGIRYLNITPGHPDYGQTLSGQTFIAQNGPGSGNHYICDNWLAIEPIDGLPLDPGATYAVVLLDGTKPKAGGEFEQDTDLKAMFSGTAPKDPLQAAAWPSFAPLRDYIAAGDGVTELRADQIVAATVFTTGRHRDLLARAREAVHEGPLQVSELHTCDAAAPSPCSSDPGLSDDERSARSCGASSSKFTEIQGRVTLPIFQEGRAPYASLGGKIQLDATGVPILHDVQNACFSLAVPAGEAPSAGWPTLVFAHGTGGSFRSAIAEGLAGRLAEVGIATLSVEGLLHGQRRGDSDSDGLVEGLPLDQLIFNLRNPDAARDNPLQAAIDQFTGVRLARELAKASAPEPAPATLDPANVFFMGHSQGAQAGLAFLPYEPEVHTAVLSGAGANLLRAILAKSEPKVTLPDGNAYPPRDLLQLAFQERPDRPLTSTHPLLLLFNTFVNRSDGDVYSPLLRRQPPLEGGAKHLLTYIGHVDNYAPLRAAGSFVVGAGLQLGDHNLFPGPCNQYDDERHDACSYTVSGFLPTTPLPASGNAGGITSVVLMREQSDGRDGHFVAFAAAEQARIVGFFDSARDGAVPVVNN
ncbi:hypothetical protein [Nannocystis sp.]|uniref:hypothetical protein n=1 Tax=Nannocystis sp. TaxID=1962667 RepID=UPI0025E51B1B|nr:hypothetical protein [Nannocystis sp.]MBK7827237.1 hypothetical protein [Nannocystis sp.]